MDLNHEFETIHELKAALSVFDDLLSGAKTFEFRRNDHGFTQGNYLLLQEYRTTRNEYTGRSVLVRVTYILAGGAFNIPPDYCIMSIERVALSREAEK